MHHGSRQKGREGTVHNVSKSKTKLASLVKLIIVISASHVLLGSVLGVVLTCLILWQIKHRIHVELCWLTGRCWQCCCMSRHH